MIGLMISAMSLPTWQVPLPTEAIRPMVQAYQRCINERLGGPILITGERVQDERKLERALERCRSVRERASAEADRLLTADPNFTHRTKRAQALSDAFAAVDRHHREQVGAIHRQFGNGLRRTRLPLRGLPPSNSFRSLDRPRPTGMTSIDVPFQIMAPWQTYSSCIGRQFTADPQHSSADQQVVRQTHAAAVSACKAVREQQLSRAFQLLASDYRPFANPAAAREAAVEAFDRIETDFAIEPSLAPSAPQRIRE
jgi:hypothetical protein